MCFSVEVRTSWCQKRTRMDKMIRSKKNPLWDTYSLHNFFKQTKMRFRNWRNHREEDGEIQVVRLIIYGGGKCQKRGQTSSTGTCGRARHLWVVAPAAVTPVIPVAGAAIPFKTTSPPATSAFSSSSSRCKKSISGTSSAAGHWPVSGGRRPHKTQE